MKSRVTALVVSAAMVVPSAGSAQRKRSVEIEITMPGGAVARAATPEDEGVIVKLVDNTRYGFVPTMLREDEKRVRLSIWDVDAKPMQKLGTVTVDIGAESIRTETSPSFRIRVIRVVKPK